jgi:hypothetical protein
VAHIRIKKKHKAAQLCAINPKKPSSSKPIKICYKPHLDGPRTNQRYYPHVHIPMTDYAGRPIEIWWINNVKSIQEKAK